MSELDVRVKLAIYEITAENGSVPSIDAVSQRVGEPANVVREAYARLAQSRLLVLEPDGATIRMAPPFSGVSTQHRVRANGIEYMANCAWDAFGIVAALKAQARVISRCEQSLESLRLDFGPDGPSPSDWRFHCLVPAAAWWRDIVFT